MEETKKATLKIDIPNDNCIVHYSNFAIVSHSPEEFVIDFATILPGKEEAKVVSRIIMTPKNFKNFVMAINNNLKNYEDQFGEIPSLEMPKNIVREVQ
ncbi:MAG: DUF3467 domain-containing protein [Brevinematales bacterium]|nr:DUF3467 domain-containing protein [Brevinematales bacterium]